MVHRDRNGRPIRESTNTEDWQEAQRKLRGRLQARDDKILDIVRRGDYMRTSVRVGTSNRRFAGHSFLGLGADDVEDYLPRRLQARVQFKTAAGVVEEDRLTPATVHQELRSFAVC
jgi:hypothetical protein